MLITDVIGFVSSVISFVLFLPQAKRTWEVRHDPKSLRGVSSGTQWLILCNATLWGVYAVMTGAFWVGAPGLVNAPLAITTLILIGRAKRITTSENDCVICEAAIPHKVFLTTNKTVVACESGSRNNGVIVFDAVNVPTLDEKSEVVSTLGSTPLSAT